MVFEVQRISDLPFSSSNQWESSSWGEIIMYSGIKQHWYFRGLPSSGRPAAWRPQSTPESKEHTLIVVKRARLMLAGKVTSESKWNGFMSDIILFHLAESLHHWLHSNFIYIHQELSYLDIFRVAGLVCLSEDEEKKKISLQMSPIFNFWKNI